MADLSGWTLKVDQFFTDTRLRNCLNIGCLYHDIHHDQRGDYCSLKTTELDSDGRCKKQLNTDYDFDLKQRDSLEKRLKQS